jgi:hypothetical protein
MKYPQFHRIILTLGLIFSLALFFFAWVVPGSADGGGWVTETPTLTHTLIPPTAPSIETLLTPEPARIVPDSGGASLSMQNEMATAQADLLLTSAAQASLLTPTAAPATSSQEISPLFMVGGLVLSMVGLVVLVFLGIRLFRR